MSAFEQEFKDLADAEARHARAYFNAGVAFTLLWLQEQEDADAALSALGKSEDGLDGATAQLWSEFKMSVYEERGRGEA